MKLNRLLTGCLAVALTGAALTSPAQASPPSGFSRYVALGDSYTAAPLVPLPELLSLGCARSYNNYPKMLASALKVRRFVDASCSGADTTHMTRPQSTFLGVARPQFAALTRDTDLVTVGIGGNDFGVFGDIIDTCPRLRTRDPAGAPCKTHFTANGVDTLKARIAQTGQRVAAVVRGIRQRSPKATILLIGYPKIAPERGTCPAILPFADGDYRYLYSVEQELNRVIQAAAAATGAGYVDTFGPSTGHDACAPDGQAWIQGKDTNLLRALSYHPRYEGQAGVAALTYRKLTGAPATITAADQARWAAEAKALARQASQQKPDRATLPSLDRLRTGAQR